MSSMFGNIKSWFSIRDEDEELDETGELGHGKVVPLSEAGRRIHASSVAVFAPRTFADVTDIADALRSRQVAIVNLQGADRTLLQRVVDFTSGVAYTIDGKIQKLAEAVYLIVPAGVQVNSAHLREQLDTDGMLDLSNRFANGARS